MNHNHAKSAFLTVGKLKEILASVPDDHIVMTPWFAPAPANGVKVGFGSQTDPLSRTLYGADSSHWTFDEKQEDALSVAYDKKTFPAIMIGE